MTDFAKLLYEYIRISSFNCQNKKRTTESKNILRKSEILNQIFENLIIEKNENLENPDFQKITSLKSIYRIFFKQLHLASTA